MPIYETTISSGGVRQWWKDADLDRLSEADLAEPREVKVELTDAETLEKLRVRALVCTDPAKLAGASRLRVRDYNTDKYRYEWVVKILEHYEEPNVEITVGQDKRRLTQGKGEILKRLLEKRDRTAGDS